MADAVQGHEQQRPAHALEEALTNANALLISSLAAGDTPCDDGSRLSQQIAAYRASIAGISNQLEHLGTSADDGDVQQQPVEHEEPSNIPGIGQEGVDYTVGIHEGLQHD